MYSEVSHPEDADSSPRGSGWENREMLKIYDSGRIAKDQELAAYKVRWESIMGNDEVVRTLKIALSSRQVTRIFYQTDKQRATDLLNYINGENTLNPGQMANAQ